MAYITLQYNLFKYYIKNMASTLGQCFTIVFLIVLNAILANKANSLVVHDETTMLKIHEQWMARHGRRKRRDLRYLKITWSW